jgi:hypothetical protein
MAMWAVTFYLFSFNKGRSTVGFSACKTENPVILYNTEAYISSK